MKVIYFSSPSKEIYTRDRKVMLSINDNYNYYFYAPIVSYLWVQMGYEPIIVVVGNQNNWTQKGKRENYVFESSRRVGATFIISDENYMKRLGKGYDTTTMVQVSRLCAGALNMYPEDSYFLTGDIDMLPLDREYFNNIDESKDVHFLHGNAYEDHSRFPICYLGMNRKLWNETMHTTDGFFEKSIVQILKRGLRPNSDKRFQWSHDELYFHRMINRWHGYKTRCQFVNRDNQPNPGYKPKMKGVPAESPVDRLERSYWNHSNGHGLVDAHCMREPLRPVNTAKLYSLLHKYIEQDQMDVFNEYKEKFIEFGGL